MSSSSDEFSFTILLKNQTFVFIFVVLCANVLRCNVKWSPLCEMIMQRSLNEYLGTICAVEGKEVDALKAQRVNKNISFLELTLNAFC